MQSSSQILLSVLEILEVRPPVTNKQNVKGSYVSLVTKDGQRFQVFAPSDSIQIRPGFDGLMICSVRSVDYFSDFQGRKSYSPAYVPSEVIHWREENQVVRRSNLWSSFVKK